LSALKSIRSAMSHALRLRNHEFDEMERLRVAIDAAKVRASGLEVIIESLQADLSRAVAEETKA